MNGSERKIFEKVIQQLSSDRSLRYDRIIDLGSGTPRIADVVEATFEATLRIFREEAGKRVRNNLLAMLGADHVYETDPVFHARLDLLANMIERALFDEVYLSPEERMQRFDSFSAIDPQEISRLNG